MIVIVDYGMGNLRSVSKALEHLGAPVRVTSDSREVERAAKLILPGVGAFGGAMEELSRRHLLEPIKRFMANRKPYLGICLGLQLLFEESEEAPGVRGLGVLPGRVRRLPTHPIAHSPHHPLKIPHMGWNQVARPPSLPAPQSDLPTSNIAGQAGATRQAGTVHRPLNGCPILKGIPEGSFFYFVHSFYADPVDHTIVALESDYGLRFTAMVWRDNLYATQFHPEKSQALGLTLLQNFVDL